MRELTLHIAHILHWGSVKYYGLNPSHSKKRVQHLKK